MQSSMEPIRILLVEDEALIRLDERMTLSKSGYEVVTAASGDEAFKTALRDSSIDLLITDVDLGPGIDGIDLARMVVDIRPMPVIFLSSLEETAICERASGIDRINILNKRISSADLVQTVEHAFYGRDPTD